MPAARILAAAGAAALSLVLAPYASAQRGTPAPSPPPLPRLQGVVKDAAGKPLEKALVMARATDAPAHERTHATRTDAAGRFTLEVGRRAVYFLRAESPGLAPHIVERLPLPAPPLTITLRKGVAIEGVVRDGRGRPVAGARVETRDRMRTGTALLFPEAGLVQATSDARGAFRLDGLRPGPYLLTAGAPGLGGASRQVVAPGSKADLFLVPGASVRGTVRGPDGKPLSAAAVSVAPELGVFGGTATVRRTSEAGAFEAWGLPAGAYVVVAHQPGLGTAVRHVVLARNAEERVDVTLESASRLRGRLVDEEQRPVRAAVALQEIEGHNVVATLGQVVTTESDPEGRFVLSEVPRAAVSLAVTSQRHAPKRVEAAVVRPDMDLGDVVVERGLAIRGIVRDAQGRPVPYANLRATGEGPGPARGALEGHAGDDGTFLLAGAQPGLYRVSATADGYTVATERGSAGGDPVVLVLERGGSVTGTVVDEKGAAVPAFRVAAEPAGDASGERTAWSEGQDGRLELADLTPGEWLLVITAAGKAEARAEGVRVRAGGVTDVGRIRMSGGQALRGRVTDGAGSPVGGASVWWEGREGAGSRGFRDAVLSDAEGIFDLNGLEDSRVDIVVDHPEYAPARATAVAVDPEAREGEVRIVLTRGARIEGTVRRREGGAPGGAHVRVGSATGRGFRMRSGPVAPDGTYSVEHVPAGTLRVMLMAATGGQSATAQQREATVAEGETAVVDFLLRDILVSGTVTRRGEAAAGVRLQLRRERAHMMEYMATSGPVPRGGPQRGWAITRADGRYDLIVDEPGRYSVSLSSSDGRVSYPARPVVVPDADGFTADFSIGGVPLSGQVLDADSGTPLAAQVTALLQAPTSPGGVRASVGRDGRFTLELEPGDYFVSAEAEGYVGTRTRVSVGDGGLDNVRLLVTRGGVISGRVVDAQGRGAGGLDVHALPDEGPAPAGGGPPTYGSARTLADGRFTITGLADGRYVLNAGDAQLGFGAVPDVAVGARDAILRLAAGGRVRVRVVAPDGSAAAMAMVGVRHVDGRRFVGGRPERTDAQGMAELAVPAGSVTLFAGSQAGMGAAAVTVIAGETAAAEIRLEPNPPGRGTR